MAKKEIVPGLVTDDDDAAPKQTVYPRSQGGAAPLSPPAAAKEIVPGLKDYGHNSVTANPNNSQGDGTWSQLAYDTFHPQPANLDRPQTWRDWVTKTYAPTPQDYGNAALDDISFGGADLAQAKLGGGNLADIRARTANSQAALGPMGPIVNALTYAIPGTGEMKMVATPGKFIGKAAQYLAPKVGRYGAAAAEGGTASALSSIGHQAGNPDGIDALQVAKDTAKGAAGGVLFQGAGDVTAPAIQRVGTYVTGKPGTGGEQWPGGTNWRDRATNDPDSVRADAAAQQALLPADDPAQPALAKVQGALAQSTDPGYAAHLTQGLVGAGAAKFGVGDHIDPFLSMAGVGSVGALTSKLVGNPAATAINTFDRNTNLGQSFDQLYPALTGNKAAVTDTSGWANALRQGWAGGERPVDQAGDAQWW